MRVLVAPDSFKGTLRAHEAADAIIKGVGISHPGALGISMPLADGGEGTVDAVRVVLKGTERIARARALSGSPIDAPWLAFGRGDALIESAAVLGLDLVPGALRNPVRYHSRGLGEVISDCWVNGTRHVFVALGDSGTNDCGMGMTYALGYSFFDADGAPIQPSYDGSIIDTLASVRRIVRPVAFSLDDITITVLADVQNPLLGIAGAAHTYARQKGFTDEQIPALEEAAASFAAVVRRDVRDIDTASPGTGAAGGLAFGLVAFCHADIVSGIDWVMEKTGFREACAASDLVITGEGKYDAQTRYGKVVHRVIEVAGECGVPVLVVAGLVESGVPTDSEGVSIEQCSPDGKAPADRHEAYDLVVKAVAGWLGATYPGKQS